MAAEHLSRPNGEPGDGEDPRQCWQCGHPAQHSLFCKYCNSLQRPQVDYYAFLGIPRKLNLDLDALQRKFYELSRLLHPDRYTLKPVTERQFSLEATAILNDAYRVLRDPVARAEYVLRENNLEKPADGPNSVPPELLEEVFEMNMALEELRSGDASVRPQLEQTRQRFDGLRRELDSKLEALFRRYDVQPGKSALEDIRAVLVHRRYVQNLLSQVNKELAG